MHLCMDWRNVNFDWNRARAFLVTADEGSFSAAARALGSTQPTIGRQVAGLEEELGVALFVRTGTQLELTTAGLDLIEHVRVMSEAATRVSLSATGQSTSVEGTVAITASETISAYLLPPVVARLRVDYPGIEIELVVSNESRDLLRREADIAIRNFQPKQPDLIARKLIPHQASMYASDAYLERVGPIGAPADLAKAEVFAFDRSALMTDGLAAMGVNLARDRFPVMTANHLVQWQMCKQGAGICIMMDAVGENEPGVQRLLPEISFPVPMWLVCHEELRTSRRIRVVFDLISEMLGTPSAQASL